MFGWLNGVVADSPLTYLVIAGLAMADIVGFVPAETVIVTATLLALGGGLYLAGVGASAAAGAFAGDCILYLLGQRLGGKVTDRLFRGRTARDRLEWARRQMQRHGSVILPAARFVPMGRTAVVFAAGTLELEWRKFVVADVVGVVLWSAYWVGFTAVTGESFSGKPWLTLVISLGVGAALGGAAELIRRYMERRR